MTMMSPGRAISPEGRADGAAERPDAFRGIFVVASSRVTFFDVLVFVALVEAVLLTVVLFAVAFPVFVPLVLVLLAVVLFVGIVRLPYPERLPPAYFFDVREADSDRFSMREDGAGAMTGGPSRRTPYDRTVLKAPSPCADLREDGDTHEVGTIGPR
jgi:hypothetical protein